MHAPYPNTRDHGRLPSHRPTYGVGIIERDIARRFIDQEPSSLAICANDDLDSIIMQLPAAFRVSPHFREFMLYRRSPNQYIYDRYIRIACGQHGVDYNLVKAIVRAESGFRPDSVSPKGAVGLMQLMPGTAKNLKVKNSLDPYQNAEAGVRYLKKMLARFENNLPLAVAAYNAGPEAVEKYHGIPPFNETQLYVQVVLVLYRHYSQ